MAESDDPGWRALADGKPAAILKANGFGMALPLDAGSHAIEFHYQTPGRATGALITLGCVILLAGLIRIRGVPAR